MCCSVYGDKKGAWATAVTLQQREELQAHVLKIEKKFSCRKYSGREHIKCCIMQQHAAAQRLCRCSAPPAMAGCWRDWLPLRPSCHTAQAGCGAGDYHWLVRRALLLDFVSFFVSFFSQFISAHPSSVLPPWPSGFLKLRVNYHSRPALSPASSPLAPSPAA